ncbi:MAG: hypothetical protein PHW24_03245 [Candidatus Moranbacteria bacterium]|nr:hypothetical protein [Candidatus Moranbacteria bacterium]
MEFTSTTNSSNQDSFTIRTMQDDLLHPQEPKHIESIQPEKSSAAEPSSKTTSPAPTPVYQKEPISEIPNPFDANPAPISNPSTSPKTNIVEITPEEDAFADNQKSPAFKLVMAIIVILIASIVALGGYYFWISTHAAKPAPAVVAPAPAENVVATPQPEPEPVTTIAPPTEKYSADKPNFMVLDLTMLSADDIKNSIGKVISELSEKNSSMPYEFTVVDANNNPIAFPIFATAIKLNLSPALLKTLSDDFSLFVYNDAGNMHLGASISIAKADLFKTEMSKQEKTLPVDLSPMFLQTKPEITTGLFKDGSYGTYKTRYLNLNTQGTLSIDYATINNNLFIGTSKMTLRSILDKKQVANTSASAATTDTNTKNVANQTTKTPASTTSNIPAAK